MGRVKRTDPGSSGASEQGIRSWRGWGIPVQFCWAPYELRAKLVSRHGKKVMKSTTTKCWKAKADSHLKLRSQQWGPRTQPASTPKSTLWPQRPASHPQASQDHHVSHREFTISTSLKHKLVPKQPLKSTNYWVFVKSWLQPITEGNGCPFFMGKCPLLLETRWY